MSRPARSLQVLCVALCVPAAGCYPYLDAAPGSLYPPHQGNEFGNEPGQDKRQDHDTCDRIPVRHEEDSSAYARRVGRKKAVKSPSGDPGFVPGQQQTAHNQPNNRRQQAETFPAFDLHALVPATHPVVEDKPPKQCLSWGQSHRFKVRRATSDPSSIGGHPTPDPTSPFLPMTRPIGSGVMIKVAQRNSYLSGEVNKRYGEGG